MSTYIQYKETDLDLSELIEKLPSPLIISQLYKNKFIDFEIRSECLRLDLISYICTFKPSKKAIETYIEIVKAMQDVLGDTAIYSYPHLTDRYTIKGINYDRTIIDKNLSYKTRKDLLKDIASKDAPFSHERLLTEILNKNTNCFDFQTVTYPYGKDAAPDLMVCGDIWLEAKASLTQEGKKGNFIYNNNNGTNSAVVVSLQLANLDSKLFNEIVIDSFYMPVYNEGMTEVLNHWWGCIVNFMPLMLDISYKPLEHLFYLVTRSDGELSKNNNAKLHPERYETYKQYTKARILTDFINQQYHYYIELLLPYKEKECMDIIECGDPSLPKNKKILQNYKNILKKQDLSADTEINVHNAELLYELETIINNINRMNTLSAIYKNITNSKYNVQKYLDNFYLFINQYNQKVCEDLAASNDVIIEQIKSIREIIIKQVETLYDKIIDNAQGLYNAILLKDKFKKKDIKFFQRQYNQILEDKKIFDNLRIIDDLEKYDLCVYNETIKGIKTILDNL